MTREGVEASGLIIAKCGYKYYTDAGGLNLLRQTVNQVDSIFFYNLYTQASH